MNVTTEDAEPRYVPIVRKNFDAATGYVFGTNWYVFDVEDDKIHTGWAYGTLEAARAECDSLNGR